MKVEQQSTEDMNKLMGYVKDSGVGMLTTMGNDGQLRSRPMMPLHIDEQGAIWFFTSRRSYDKESREGLLNLTFSDAKDGKFVALSGTSSLVDDPSRARELWSPIMRAWFPEGPDDPDLTLLRVHVQGGEYWASSNSAIVRFAAHAVSAIAGRPIGLGENETVTNP